MFLLKSLFIVHKVLFISTLQDYSSETVSAILSVDVDTDGLSIPVVDTDGLSIPVCVATDGLPIPVGVATDGLPIPVVDTDGLLIPVGADTDGLSIPVGVETDGLSIPVGVDTDGLSIPVGYAWLTMYSTFLDFFCFDVFRFLRHPCRLKCFSFCCCGLYNSRALHVMQVWKHFYFSCKLFTCKPNVHCISGIKYSSFR